MNVRWLLTLAGLSLAHAQAPVSLGDLVYYETGRTTARTTYATGIHLQANGVARGLFFISTGIATSTYITSGISTGTWTYVAGLNGAGELQLNLPAGGIMTSGRRRLTFEGPGDHGRAELDDSFSAFGLTFTLAPASERSPLVNCSNRSMVVAGRSAFSGFVVTGDRPRAVLVRAIGPGLRAFGISDALVDPRLSLRRGDALVSENDDWELIGGTSISATSAFVGAFPLTAGSKDAALIVLLQPGDYVAEVKAGTTTDAGQALMEVYMLP